MGFLKKIFSGGPKIEVNTLVNATEIKQVALLDLLMRFSEPRPLHDNVEQQRWTRSLPHSYQETIQLFTKQGLLAATPQGQYQATPAVMPAIHAYQERLAREKAEVIPQVRAALEKKETSEALTLRRFYEARF